MSTKQKQVPGPDLSAVRHLDSETSPKWETLWIALLRGPCAIYNVTKKIMYEWAAPLNAPLPLQDLVLSNRHKQHSLITTSKISHCFPPLQITKSKKILPATTNFTQPYTPLPKHIRF